MQSRTVGESVRCVEVCKDVDDGIAVIGSEFFTENDLGAERIFVGICTPCVNDSVFHRNKTSVAFDGFIIAKIEKEC